MVARFSLFTHSVFCLSTLVPVRGVGRTRFTSRTAHSTVGGEGYVRMVWADEVCVLHAPFSAIAVYAFSSPSMRAVLPSVDGA